MDPIVEVEMDKTEFDVVASVMSHLLINVEDLVRVRQGQGESKVGSFDCSQHQEMCQDGHDQASICEEKVQLVADNSKFQTEEKQHEDTLDSCMVMAVLQNGSPPKIEMIDCFTAMSQEMNSRPTERKDAFTAMSQEFENAIDVCEICPVAPAVEKKDADTTMSQEFLMLQLPQVNHRDNFTTTSIDLNIMADVGTQMDIINEQLSSDPHGQLQLVPTDSMNEKENTEQEGELYGANVKIKELVEVDSSHGHDSHDYHLVPEDRNECVLVQQNEPAFRMSKKDVKISVAETDSPTSQLEEESLRHSNSNVSRFYEYSENMDEDKENIAPQRGVQSGLSERLHENEEIARSKLEDVKPRPSPPNSGIFLRLGLSKRSKPTKRLHDPFRRLL